MDPKNRGRHSHELTTVRSNLRRVQSLPNHRSYEFEFWGDDPRYETPFDLNSPIETTINPESGQGYETDQPPDLDHISVGPFGSSTSLALRPQTPFDVNLYQQKKTLAQGMMDLALISANANQMRYVLQLQDQSFYTPAICMIVTSLILQVVVGIGLIWNTRYDVKEQAHTRHANKTNNWTVIGIFLVTILNVFISSFGVSGPNEASMRDSIVQFATRHDTYKHNLPIYT